MSKTIWLLAFCLSMAATPLIAQDAPAWVVPPSDAAALQKAYEAKLAAEAEFERVRLLVATKLLAPITHDGAVAMPGRPVCCLSVDSYARELVFSKDFRVAMWQPAAPASQWGGHQIILTPAAQNSGGGL